MVNIQSVRRGGERWKGVAICVFFLMRSQGSNVSLADCGACFGRIYFQFVLKMAIVIGVAWLRRAAAGGMQQMLSTLAAKRAAAGPEQATSRLFCLIFRGLPAKLVDVAGDYLVVHLAVQWWAFWYPGANRRRRIYRATDLQRQGRKRNGLLSVHWFNLARIRAATLALILTALAAVVHLYPALLSPSAVTCLG